jgi:hypothetical protein
MIELEASIDLSNLTFLINDLRKGNLMTNNNKSTESVLLILLAIIVRDGCFLHQTV